MPRLVDGESRTQEVARAINDVLAEGGIPALTMRSITERLGLSASTLHAHYGSRERMLLVVGCFVGRLRVEHIEVGVQTDGVTAFLPVDDDELIDLRAWLGWCELARSASWLTAPLQTVLDQERDVLARAVAHRLRAPELEWLGAVIDGLGARVCRPVRPMSRSRARELLSQATRQLVPDDVEPATPPFSSPAFRLGRQAGRGALSR